MFTVHEDSERLFQSLMAGANGYILKRTSPAQVLEAITDVVKGGAPMSRSIARKVLQHFHKLRPPAAELAQLTTREREILDRLATGYTYKEIASAVGISFETVKAHLRNIYKKLHVSSGKEAMRKLVQGA
jgi:DNA-binding NarL/FixJ family response regulator